ADHNLFRIERNMARHHAEDLLAQQHQQIGLATQPALMREQDLQPLPRDRRRGWLRRGHGTVREKPEYAHAALRPNNSFISPLGSLGTIISMVSPSSRRVASA